MKPETPYDAWKSRRSSLDVPEGFADRVLAALPRGQQYRQSPGVNWFFVALLDSRLGKAGVCMLGCLACVFRIASLVALFLPR
jgi:hypothetical protein